MVTRLPTQLLKSLRLPKRLSKKEKSSTKLRRTPRTATLWNSTLMNTPETRFKNASRRSSSPRPTSMKRGSVITKLSSAPESTVTNRLLTSLKSRRHLIFRNSQSPSTLTLSLLTKLRQRMTFMNCISWNRNSISVWWPLTVPALNVTANKPLRESCMLALIQRLTPSSKLPWLLKSQSLTLTHSTDKLSCHTWPSQPQTGILK